MSDSTQPDPTPLPYEVTIQWGEEATRRENPGGFVTYGFETLAELRAFEQGVDEGCGWMDYINISTQTPEEGMVRGAGWPADEN